MKSWILFTVVCGMFCLAQNLLAVEEEQVVEVISCSHGEDVRKLEISTKGAGCELHYFKAGKSSRIAKANRGVDVCKDRLQQVRKTLEGSSYQCK